MLAAGLLLLQLTCVMIRMTNANYTAHPCLCPEQDTPAINVHLAALPPGYIRHPEIGSSYKIFPRLVKWAKARKACTDGGGRLAVIDTTEKMEYLRSQRKGIASIWLGIFRADRDANWTAVDNSEISQFLPWRHLFRGASRNCLVMSGTFPGLSNWTCIQKMRYVCEITD